MKLSIHRKKYSCKVRAMGRTGAKALWCKPTKKRKGVSARKRKSHEKLYRNFNPTATFEGRRKRRFRF